MGEDEKGSRADLGSLLEQLVERPELLHNVRFADANTIDFVIGDKRGAYTLSYLPPNQKHGNLPCYLLNHTGLTWDEGADLWRALQTAGRDTLARTLERDMTQEVLVSPEQEAELAELEALANEEKDGETFRERMENAKRAVTELPYWLKNQQSPMEAGSRLQMSTTECGETPQSDGWTFNIDLR